MKSLYLYIFIFFMALVDCNNLRSVVDIYKEIRKSQMEKNNIIKGINWFGFETEYNDLQCVWTHEKEWHIQKIKELGFNTIRLPFSLDYILNDNWSAMDDFFYLTHKYNIDVVLDFHRLYSTRQSPKPDDGIYSFNDFLNGWNIIIDRYKTYPNLKYIDIFNEYQGLNYNEWNDMAKTTIEFIEEKFPNQFHFFVGGVSWGGNLRNINIDLEHMNDRITYTIHKYHFSDSPPYEEKWDYSFGDQPKKNVGEWGYISSNIEESLWAENFVNYLKSKNIRDTMFWTWSFNSGDTGGVLKEDCETIDYDKMKLLYSLWYN